MDTIFMNSRNNDTCDLHRLIVVVPHKMFFQIK